MDSIDYNVIKRAVLTIGNFDGVHLGHKRLIDTVVQSARREEGPGVLYTFFPHPAQVLFPERKHQLLYSIEKNKEILRTMGLDHLIVQSFTGAFSRLSPEKFIEQYIVSPIQPILIIVGYNFRFGADSAGSIRLLEKLQEKHKFRLKVIPPVKWKDVIVSSSSIKQAILSGNWDLVKSLLGRFFSIRGVVVKGEGRGKTLGFPTINLKVDENILVPINGVYTVRVIKNNQYFYAIANIGTNPTFSASCLKKIEIHLIGKDEQWQDRECEMEIMQYIRPEYKFSNSAELVDQIRKDIHQACSYLDGI